MIALKDPRVVLTDIHYQIIADAVKEAHEIGVTRIVNIGTSIKESNDSIEIAKKFESVFASIGIHPCDSKEVHSSCRDIIKQLRALLANKSSNKVVAIGEIGLDFFHKPYDKQQQIDFFKAQIEWHWNLICLL
jgi:TatD DNase family protein